MNRSIIEDYKSGIFHSGFSVFYGKELDKYVVKRQPIEAEERVKVIKHMEDNGIPPEGYLVSVKENGATIKRYFSKKKNTKINQEIDVIKVAEILVKKKTKKEFKDEVL
jgi:aromatic ring hydroxylase